MHYPEQTTSYQRFLRLVDVHALRRHVETISVEIGPRPFASLAEAKAADYVAQELAHYGWQPSFRTISLTSYEHFTQAEIISPQRRQIPCELYIELHSGDRRYSIEAPVTNVETMDIPQNAIALLPSDNFLPLDRIAKLRTYKVAAVLTWYRFAGQAIKSPMLRDEIQRLGALLKGWDLPIFVTSEATGQHLAEMMKQGPTLLKIETEVKRVRAPSHTVVGMTETRIGREVIMSAHHDSYWGVPTPGASDNASGVAILLEVARILSPSVRSDLPLARIPMRIISFGAEEYRRMGSLAYCFPSIRRLSPLIHPVILEALCRVLKTIPWFQARVRHVRAMINVDSVKSGISLVVGTAPLTSNRSGILYTAQEAVTKAIAESSSAGCSVKYVPSGINAGDGRWFAELGVPVISLTSISPGLSIYEHSTADTIDLLNFSQLREATALVCLLICSLTSN